MKNSITEFVFIFDQSESIIGLESNTIRGFNSLIERQKRSKESAMLSLNLFSKTTNIRNIHSYIIEDIEAPIIHEGRGIRRLTNL